MIERRPPVLFNQFADLAERAGEGLVNGSANQCPYIFKAIRLRVLLSSSRKHARLAARIDSTSGR